jgi:hypothetical protein
VKVITVATAAGAVEQLAQTSLLNASILSRRAKNIFCSVFIIKKKGVLVKQIFMGNGRAKKLVDKNCKLIHKKRLTL